MNPIIVSLNAYGNNSVTPPASPPPNQFSNTTTSPLTNLYDVNGNATTVGLSLVSGHTGIISFSKGNHATTGAAASVGIVPWMNEEGGYLDVGSTSDNVYLWSGLTPGDLYQVWVYGLNSNNSALLYSTVNGADQLYHETQLNYSLINLHSSVAADVNGEIHLQVWAGNSTPFTAAMGIIPASAPPLITSATIDSTTVSGQGDRMGSLTKVGISAGGFDYSVTSGITSTTTSFSVARPASLPVYGNATLTATSANGTSANFVVPINNAAGTTTIVAGSSFDSTDNSLYFYNPATTVTGTQVLFPTTTDGGGTLTVSTLGIITDLVYKDGSGNVIAAPASDTISGVKYWDPATGVLSAPSVDPIPMVNGSLAPQVLSVQPPASATYVTGNTLTITVNTNTNVTVTGTPRIPITIGTTTKYANYQGGTGTSALTFTYTIQTADSDTNGIAIGAAIDPNAGSIVDVNSTVLDYTLYNIGSSSGVLVNPSGQSVTAVSSVSVPSAGTYGVGSVLSFTVTLTAAGTVTGTPRIPLTIGAATQYANYQSGTGTTSLVFSYTVQAGDMAPSGISVGAAIDPNAGSIVDLSSNAISYTLNSVGATTGVVVDTSDKVPNAFSFTSLTGVGLGQTITSNVITVTGVTAATNIPISITGGNYSVSTDGGTTWSAFVSTSGNVQLNDQVMVEVTSSQNYNSSTTATLNIGGVTAGFTASTLNGISSVGVPASGSYSIGASLQFTVNTTSPVTVAGSPTIPLVIGTTARSAQYISGSGTSSLAFTYVTQSGDKDTDGITVGSAISAGTGNISDSNGNPIDYTLNSVGSTAAVLVDAASPYISGIDKSSVIAGDTLTISGALFFAVQGSVTIQDTTTGVSSSQEIVSWSDASIVIHVLQGDLIYSSSLEVIVTRSDAQQVIHSPLTLAPPTGYNTVTITTPVTTGSHIPGVTTGDIVEFETDAREKVATVSLNADAAFSTTDSKYARSVSYRVWNATTKTWGPTQYEFEAGKPRNDSDGGDASKSLSIDGSGNPILLNSKVAVKAV